MTHDEAATIVSLAYHYEEHTGQYVQGTYQLVLKAIGLYPDLVDQIGLSVMDTLERKEQRCRTR